MPLCDLFTALLFMAPRFPVGCWMLYWNCLQDNPDKTLHLNYSSPTLGGICVCRVVCKVFIVSWPIVVVAQNKSSIFYTHQWCCQCATYGNFWFSTDSLILILIYFTANSSIILVWKSQMFYIPTDVFFFFCVSIAGNPKKPALISSRCYCYTKPVSWCNQ